MTTDEVTLPLVDLSGYINPKAPGDKERVIEEVRAACAQYGFFQTTGHGIPIETQEGLLQSINTLFDMPKEEKRKLSFLENPCRRGYEASGMSLREGDAMSDSKEVRCSVGLYPEKAFLLLILHDRLLTGHKGLLHRSRGPGSRAFRLLRPQRLASSA